MSTTINPFEGLIAAIADETARRVLAVLRSTSSPEPAPRMCSVRQAATYLGRDEQTVRKLIRQGKLRSTQYDGRITIDRADLDALIDASKG